MEIPAKFIHVTVKTAQIWTIWVWIKYASRINENISCLWRLLTMRSKSQSLIDFNDKLNWTYRWVSTRGAGQREESNKIWTIATGTSVFLQQIQIQIQIHQQRCDVCSTMPTNTNTNTSGAVWRLFSFNDAALQQPSSSSMWEQQTSLLDITTIRTQ